MLTVFCAADSVRCCAVLRHVVCCAVPCRHRLTPVCFLSKRCKEMYHLNLLITHNKHTDLHASVCTELDSHNTAHVLWCCRCNHGHSSPVMVNGTLLWSPPVSLHCSNLNICWPAGCAEWTASQMGGGFANPLYHEGTPLEAYRQRARGIRRASLTRFTNSPVVRSLSSESLLQAQHNMNIQCHMCELCPGLQLELTLQQSDLGTLSTWPGKEALKKQSASCT
ncbi:TPA: hypothetical protein ACH3X1_005294 [Trebouxia sp. C0004]